MTCHCSLDPQPHTHDLPPGRCFCTDSPIEAASDHWPTCPQYRRAAVERCCDGEFCGAWDSCKEARR